MANMSLAALAGILRAAASHASMAEHQGRKAAGEVLEAEAKAEIGRYQPAAPPFPKWAKLADSTILDRMQNGYPADEPLLREGTLRDSISHGVQGTHVVVGTSSDIGLYQEMGTRRIPPRSYLGRAVVVKGQEALDAFAKEVLPWR